jgi:hypothetical protein
MLKFFKSPFFPKIRDRCNQYPCLYIQSTSGKGQALYLVAFSLAKIQ